MKLLAPAILALLAASSCDKPSSVSAAKTDTGGKAAPVQPSPEAVQKQALKAEGTQLVAQVNSKLEGVSDLASAESATRQLEPLIKDLGEVSERLGSDQLDLSPIQRSIQTLSSRFASDPQVLDVLQPTFEKLQELLS